MLKCMATNGFLSDEAEMTITAQDPYEYLQTAEVNQRSVGFVPAGTKVCLPVVKAPWHGYCPVTACTNASVLIKTRHTHLPCSLHSWPYLTSGVCGIPGCSGMADLYQLHATVSTIILMSLLPALQFEENWHDEKLMEVLTQACQVIPRQPASAPSSAPAILERWRSRLGVVVTSEEPQQNAAWEVRGRPFDLALQPDTRPPSVCAMS